MNDNITLVKKSLWTKLEIPRQCALEVDTLTDIEVDGTETPCREGESWNSQSNLQNEVTAQVREPSLPARQFVNADGLPLTSKRPKLVRLDAKFT